MTKTADCATCEVTLTPVRFSPYDWEAECGDDPQTCEDFEPHAPACEWCGSTERVRIFETECGRGPDGERVCRDCVGACGCPTCASY